MNRKTDWLHPVDTSDQWDGFNDSGIETFSGSPIVNLAREIIQNALDAATERPVKVTFSLETRNVCDIPDVDSLKETFQYCAKSAKHEGKKAKAFLERAERLLEKRTFKVLEISDFNTTGVVGPCRKGSPFYALLKAKGQSNKPSATSSGSYGIGKFAPYAVSALRTVFVSTIYKNKDKDGKDKGELVQLTQGKSILMSHEVGDKTRQGTGFWGIPAQCQAVAGDVEIAPWLLRSPTGKAYSPEDIGTKICVFGFESKKNWAELLALSIAVNFFGALVRGELEVQVGGEIELNSATVADILNSESNSAIIRGSSLNRTDVENCQSYLEALVSEQAIDSQSEMRELGLTDLRLLIREGLPRRVAVIRNGMFITDRLEGLKRFGGFKEFSGVLECKNDSGNELLRSIEPPRHDNFEPDRAATDDDREKATAALNELAEWVRKMLTRYAKDEVADVTSVDELADYFGDDADLGSGETGEESDPLGGVLFSPRPIKRTKVRLKNRGDDRDSGGEGEGDEEGGGGSTGEGGGDGRGGTGSGEGGQSGATASPNPIRVKNARVIAGSGTKRTIALTPEVTSKARLSLYLAGADRDEPLVIKDSSKGVVHSGAVQIDVEAGRREMLEVEFDSKFAGAIRVVLHEI